MLKLKRAVALIWQSTPRWMTLHVGITIAQSILPLIQLYIIKLIVDDISRSLTAANKLQYFNSILSLLLCVGVTMLGSHLVSAIAELTSSAITQRVTDHVQVSLYRKAIEIDIESHENPHYQDLLERAKWEAPYRPTTMLNNLTAVGQSLVSLSAIVGILFTIHWALISILCFASLPSIWVRFRHSKRLYRWRIRQTQSERKALYIGHLLLCSYSAKEIRLFNTGQWFIEQFQVIRHRLLREKLAIIGQQAIARLLTQSFTIVMVLGAYGVMIYQTLHGHFQMGDLVLYSQIFQRGQGAFSELVRNLAALYEGNLFLSDFFEFLALKPTITLMALPQSVPHPMQRGIVFQDVSFQYQNSTRQAIQRVNFAIAPGEVVALVGENGSGKTTLAKLLCRLYDVTEGKITIDGVDLRHIDPLALQRQISVIFQDFIRYQVSAEDNIWLGNVDLPPKSERILQAAQRSGAAAVIERLPQGYDTLLGKWFQGGEELSGGQWQKVALARAFVRDAQLVVLDEPTSAMDAKAEEEVFQTFRELMRDRAALLITHRLSTVKMADRIYVLHQGEIVESGTHDQLMAQQGTYAHLFETQARNYQ